MKKKNLKNLKLNKIKVTKLEADFSINGGWTPQSIEPEFCNWTYNRWCYSNGRTNCFLCTAPK